MASHFQNYVSNLNRVRLAELIDHHELQGRIDKARPSLIVNPLTSVIYGGVADECSSGRGK